MNAKRILVTGASGFAAPYLIASLVHNEPQSRILGISRHLPKQGRGLAKRVTFRSVDLTDFRALEKAIRSFRPTQVYHLAGLSSVADSFEDPSSIFHANVEGAANLLESLIKARLKPRILLISTGQVYGRTFLRKPAPSEQDPVLPMSPYALSKRMMEELGLYYFHNYGLPVMVARPFNHFGLAQSSSVSLMNFILQFSKMRSGRRNKLFVGNVDVTRDFSDVRDIVDGYRAILREGRPGEIYNLGNGRTVPLRKVIQELEKMSGYKAKIVPSISPSPLNIRAMQANIRKAQRSIGWRPRYSLKETLGEVYRFYTN